jgi:hypothetical protein
MKMTVVVAAMFVLAVGPAVAQDAPKPSGAGTAQPRPQPKPDQAELEKQFEQNMSGATLVGRFSVEGRGNRAGGEPKEERYQILKVTKTSGDYWLFNARVQYGNKDVTAPIVLQVKWAGDTPVITLTDLPIPGLGTYTARVLIYRDHYAGYWSGGDHGGNLWGRVEREKPADGATGAAETPAPARPEHPK